jgi:hypothetical protein
MDPRAYCLERTQETGRPYMLVTWPETPGAPVLAWYDCPFNRRAAREIRAICTRVKPQFQRRK